MWAVGIDEQDITVGVSFTLLPCRMLPWPDPRQVSFIASIIKYHAMTVLPFELISGKQECPVSLAILLPKLWQCFTEYQ